MLNTFYSGPWVNWDYNEVGGGVTSYTMLGSTSSNKFYTLADQYRPAAYEEDYVNIYGNGIFNLTGAQTGFAPPYNEAGSQSLPAPSTYPYHRSMGPSWLGIPVDPCGLYSTPVLTSPMLQTSYHLTALSSPYTDVNGQVWTPLPAGVFLVQGGSYAPAGINDTLLYSLQQYGQYLYYSLGVPNAVYTVTLLMYDVDQSVRAINIAINGVTVLTGFSPAPSTGPRNQAFDVTVTGQNITIFLWNGALLNGIQIQLQNLSVNLLPTSYRLTVSPTPYHDYYGQLWSALQLTLGTGIQSGSKPSIYPDSNLYYEIQYNTALSYNFQVQNGVYSVTMLFFDIDNAQGRSISVAINNVNVLSSFNPAATFPLPNNQVFIVTVVNQTISIVLNNNPILNGIQIQNATLPNRLNNYTQQCGLGQLNTTAGCVQPAGNFLCGYNGTVCQPPTWTAQWSLNYSIITNPGVSTDYWTVPAGQTYGLVALDWTIASRWSGLDNGNYSNNTVEATLTHNCQMIRTANTRCFIYYNAEVALQVMESQRAVMYDPLRQHYFLFKTDESAPFDQPNPDAGDQYFWDYRNPDMRAFMLQDVLNLVSSPYVDGVYVDDPLGLPEELFSVEYYGVTDLEGSDFSVLQYWTSVVNQQILNSLIALGKYTYAAFGYGSTMGPGVTSAGCVQFFLDRCTAEWQLQTMTMQFDPTQQAIYSVAAFLIVRPPIAFLGNGFNGGSVPTWDPIFLTDVGAPTGQCYQLPAGPFTRAWSHGNHTFDCNNYLATVSTPTGVITSH